VKLLNLNI